MALNQAPHSAELHHQLWALHGAQEGDRSGRSCPARGKLRCCLSCVAMLGEDSQQGICGAEPELVDRSNMQVQEAGGNSGPLLE